ncbi:hypothetical protein FB45DRAFT_1053257 [Roridomyces roridus]|uniref:F-box domain-containing protein n=1 Tax=Roridomyces roridus TaxID=1738132 RepID=A0AAD7CBN3_9AGAR|nr:hypothetical protein FB45DRAFT_1053257 [Roridomyces roridus]
MSKRLRSRLAEIEQQIGALQAQISQLRSEHKKVARELKAITYPILSLPNEITVEIFLHYVDKRPAHGPLRLTWVCRLWREVATSAYRLWTSFDSQQLPFVELLSMWFSRSGGLPLTFSVTLPPATSEHSQQFFQVIGRHSAQWETLNFRSNVPQIPDDMSCIFPRLKRLSFYSPGVSVAPPRPFDTPLLRELQLHFVMSPKDWQKTFPWTQLTTLKILGDVNFHLEFLTHIPTPSLEVLHMETDDWTVDPPDPSTVPSFILPRLHTLNLDTKGSQILAYLTLPALQGLSIYIDGEDTPHSVTDEVMDFITRSGCTLRALRRP